MVGSAIKKHLEHLGYTNLICRTSKELNLINQTEVERFFSQEKPEIVILTAGKVGGILANDTYRAEFGSELKVMLKQQDVFLPLKIVMSNKIFDCSLMKPIAL